MKNALQLSNRALLDAYFSDYQKDKNLVSLEWQEFFDSLSFKESVSSPLELSDLNTYRLIEAYRAFGHLSLSFHPTKKERSLSLLRINEFGFSQADLEKNVKTFGLLKEEYAPLSQLIKRLEELYTTAIGYEYMGFTSKEVESFLKQRIEERAQTLSLEQKKTLLQELFEAELFETFLHTKYPGQKRFSLEGAETLIPLLSQILKEGSEKKVEIFVIGMAHRGRLNVLSNILKKSYQAIFEEFNEGFRPENLNSSGDVKYHKGFKTKRTLSNGQEVALFLTSNPSHLESVAPVALGQAYAFQKKTKKEAVLPILIHGDAALSGQGVVYETLQLHGLEGYNTQGTLHIVINNHIGFTTLPEEGRSTTYCTDIAKTFGAPVFHLNVEEPESCLIATSLALEIRNRFHIDVFLELNGYRKYGHNESDEPAFTQPLQYEVIRRKKSIKKIYEEKLIDENLITSHEIDQIEKGFRKKIEEEPNKTIQETPLPSLHPIEKKEFKLLSQKLTEIPEGLTPHPKIKKLLDERLQMIEGKLPVDFPLAELLSFASLLNEGIGIRLTGQDVRRGTFSQRHAFWYDQKTEKAYTPLAHLSEKQAFFECFNSPLSEYASLGFEFGISTILEKELTLWEAQFGDFANGAQIIIDQYLSTSEDKWGLRSNLTLLLPHGYEGQGPEHSSARIERFLSLSAKNNMIVANPTTAAQYFHLLRGHGHSHEKKPLIIFTPKALLRLKEAGSPIDELENGVFKEILEDSRIEAETVILCSGKIYYDLLKKRKEEAIIRIEKLYPLDEEMLKLTLKKYTKATKIFFAQEEPKNMGAFPFLEPRLKKISEEIVYVGREESASPATGFPALHKEELETLLKKIF
jgi:2-oxoglutarate dehydrogenase E1 component